VKRLVIFLNVPLKVNPICYFKLQYSNNKTSAVTLWGQYYHSCSREPHLKDLSSTLLVLKCDNTSFRLSTVQMCSSCFCPGLGHANAVVHLDTDHQDCSALYPILQRWRYLGIFNTIFKIVLKIHARHLMTPQQVLVVDFRLEGLKRSLINQESGNASEPTAAKLII
jgi:hypothetical protein